MKEIMEKSIGKDNIQKLEMKQKKVSSKVLKIATAVFATIIVAGSVKISSDIQENKINHELYLETYGRDRAVEYQMNKYDLVAYSKYGEPIVNNLEDYQRIESLREEYLDSYYRVLGEEECEKVVIALGYKNWEDYLTRNNYYDENGKPSIEKWLEHEEEMARERAEEKVKGRSR